MSEFASGGIVPSSTYVPSEVCWWPREVLESSSVSGPPNRPQGLVIRLDLNLPLRWLGESDEQP